MTETLTRYVLGEGGTDTEHWPDMVAEADGPWVRYADAAAALTAAHAERDAARQECDELQQRAYQMIAGIEADAATLVATRRECDARVEQATHAARHAIEGAAEQMNVLRAQRAAVIAEKDHLRRRLTAALRERDALAAELARTRGETE